MKGRGNMEEELLKRYISVCKVSSDHNVNLKWAVLKTKKGTKQNVDTEE